MKGIEPSLFFTRAETENISTYFITLPSVEANFTQDANISHIVFSPLLPTTFHYI